MEQSEVDPKSISNPLRPRPWLQWRWLRDFAVVVFILVCAWKLLHADLNINIGEFSFSDLLALILALFSVWLSAMFYFKADDASSRFYDNSYRFTQEMHVILGRMEAGFGERLKSMTEGVSGLRTAFDAQVAKEVVVSEKEAEVQQFAEDLSASPPGSAAETELVADLRRAHAELADARAELERLRAAASHESRLNAERIEQIPNRQMAVIARHILDRQGIEIASKPISLSEVRKLYKVHCAEFHQSLLLPLRRAGWIDETGTELNTMGASVLRTSMWAMAGMRKD